MVNTLVERIYGYEKFDDLDMEEREEKDKELVILNNNSNIKNIIDCYEYVLFTKHIAVYEVDDHCLTRARIKAQSGRENLDNTFKETITAEEIYIFSKYLYKYQNYQFFDRSYIYLNYLINKTKDKEITIDTRDLNINLDLLGDNLKDKTLNLIGDQGHLIGISMRSGRINIYGNCGHSIGREFYDGEIHIFGKFKSIDNEYGCDKKYQGKIFCNGRYIFKNKFLRMIQEKLF